jgi:hypothetical protein
LERIFHDGQNQTNRRTPPEHKKGPVMKSPQANNPHLTLWSAIRLALPAVASLLFASPAVLLAGNDNRAPEVPAALQVPSGNKVSFHVYAVGVQIYTAAVSPTDPTKFVWTFKAPEAVLFDSDGDVVGIHYAGPTWESDSGSKVVGARLAGATVDATAIPWLLLKAKTTEGPGILERTTYIQRVNTAGGLTQATAPTQAGQEARVPYAAEYYFYREAQH